MKYNAHAPKNKRIVWDYQLPTSSKTDDGYPVFIYREHQLHLMARKSWQGICTCYRVLPESSRARFERIVRYGHPRQVLSRDIRLGILASNVHT